MISREQGDLLLSIARTAISKGLGQDPESPAIPEEYTSWLQQKAACFVTLNKNGQLRGCIGSLQPRRPLIDDLKSNATAAAFEDPRFSPLTKAELSAINIEVSLLSPLQPLQFKSEQDALAQLQPGVDGVVFEYGHYRSTFLPQVWQQLPSKKEFMAHLKLKAGLSANFWNDEVRLQHYTVSKYSEQD